MAVFAYNAAMRDQLFPRDSTMLQLK